MNKEKTNHKKNDKSVQKIQWIKSGRILMYDMAMSNQLQ